jgi:hypothetical protein
LKIKKTSFANQTIKRGKTLNPNNKDYFQKNNQIELIKMNNNGFNKDRLIDIANTELFNFTNSQAKTLNSLNNIVNEMKVTIDKIFQK